MEKGRFDLEESLTFTKTQAYLILGCIVAIAVLSFSLGHLVSRSTSPELPKEAEEASSSENNSQVAAETRESLEELNDRLVKTEEAASGLNPAGDGIPASEADSTLEETSNSGIIEDQNVINLTMEAKSPVPPQAEEEQAEVKLKSLGPDRKKALVVALKKNTRVNKTAVKSAAKRAVRTAQAPTAVNRKVETAKVSGAVLPPKLPRKIETVRIKPEAPARTVKPVEIASISNNSIYTVQVKTFPTEERALELESQLKKNGYHAYIHKKASGRNIWFRVRVGGFKTKAAAEEVAAKISDSEGIGGIRVDRYQKIE